MKRRALTFLLALLLLLSGGVEAAGKKDKKAKGEKEEEKEEEKGPLSSGSFSALKFRTIGPAVTSGRVSDIAVHPTDPHTWIVTVASGGVWRTTNHGTTFEPNNLAPTVCCYRRPCKGFLVPRGSFDGDCYQSKRLPTSFWYA